MEKICFKPEESTPKKGGFSAFPRKLFKKKIGLKIIFTHQIFESVTWKNTSYELRVKSFKARLESLKAQVEIQKCEFKSTSNEFKSTSYKFKSIS